MERLKPKFLAMCAFVMLVLGGVAAQAARQEWAARYDSGAGADYAKDIAVDSSGNIYVTGSIAGDGWEYATIKYNSAGTQQWVKTYDGPVANDDDGASAIAADSSGNVYVTGYSWQGATKRDIVTIKYATDGTQLWAAPPVYDGGNNEDDSAYDIAVDSISGDVYVTGMSYTGNHWNCVTIKYNSAGAEQWAHQYDGGWNSFDAGYAIALDSGGNIAYVGGTCVANLANEEDYMVLKYAAAGGAPVVATYDGSNSDNDRVRDIAVDSSGNVYVTGIVNFSGDPLEHSDCVTIKYNAALAQVWVKTYDNGINDDDDGQAIVLDSSSNVYVAGRSCGVGTNTDYVTIMYSPGGVQQWASRYNGPGNSVDCAYDIDLDNSGNVYVTGWSCGVTSWDYATIMYDSAGNEKWVMRYDGPGAPAADYGWAIAVYDKDNIYVTGESEIDYATVKYSQRPGITPSVKWLQLPDETENGIDIRCDSNDRTLADDFECNQPSLITDVHFWGSWKGDTKGNIIMIHLSIHGDIPDPDGEGPLYSMPNEPNLWSMDFYSEDFNETLYKELPEPEWWWDPCTGQLMPEADHQIWQYDVYIDPNKAFVQEGDPCNPVTYWLDVYVETDGTGEFGWKTRDPCDGHFADDAVYRDDPNWLELRYPPGHPYHASDQNSIDMAFMITTQPAPEPPKPPVEHLKWSQPPIEIDPNADTPTYCGWDEDSYTNDPAVSWKMVADDYRCLGTMPVTSIHWWGSYFYWDSNDPPQPEPIAWRIGFWSNVPAGIDAEYSHPETLLWQIELPTSRVQRQWVGIDQFPEKHSDTCFQYYVDLEPAEYFWQDAFDANTQEHIYWLSIATVYQQGVQVNNPWGWKTRPWSWMDDAVTFSLNQNPQPGISFGPGMFTPIKYQGESYDVTFELDTDPNYIKWEQAFTGIRHWPHYEDEKSMERIDEPEGNRLVADDWHCDQNTPVMAVVWWGSYIGYRYTACQGGGMALPVKPDYFDLQIWDDVAAGEDPCVSYSHPNDVIWQYRAYEYDEVLVGYDKHPEFGQVRQEPVFRYSVRIPDEEWYIQRDANSIHWLSVVAVYETGNTPNYDWGWTNHEHVYNDDAVAGTWDDENGKWIWDELFDQTGASEDMSFILFTDPNKCFNCADYNGDGIVNFLDYADFADDWLWTGPCGGVNKSDLNCDGVADFKDLRIFALQWLESCP